MKGCMEGKVALVTGAGRGIGRAIALLMAQSGASVVVNDFGTSVRGEGSDASFAEQVVEEIRGAGGRAVAHAGSVANQDDAVAMVEAAVESFGRIDAVVNNAGIVRDRIFHQLEAAEWQAVIDVVLTGPFNVSSAAARHFRRQESGAFVHLTSTAGLIGSFGQANYAAAKLGLVGLSKSIALDMKRYNVRSNCVSPFAFSRMIAAVDPKSANYEKRVGRMKEVTSEKVAPLAVYLASDAAEGVSGQIFAARKNEIFLFNQPRPIRGIHDSRGWTPETIAEHAMPAMRSGFTPLDVTADVFGWDPA